jgi:hypothetical protein
MTKPRTVSWSVTAGVLYLWRSHFTGAAMFDNCVVEPLGTDAVDRATSGQSPFLQARYKDLNHKKEFVNNLVEPVLDLDAGS